MTTQVKQKAAGTRGLGYSAALLAARVGVVVIPILLWQLAVERRIIPSYVVGSPTLIFEQLVEWVKDGSLFHQTAWTLRNAGLGYLLGMLAGSVLAVVFSMFPGFSRLYFPVMAALNGIPRLALAPLVVVWLGLGWSSAVVLAAIATLFVNFFAVYGGLQSVPRHLVAWVRTIGGSGMAIWTHLIIPSIAFWVLSAMRLSMGFALGAAVVAEFVGPARGLGYLVSRAGQTFRPSEAFAAMVIILVVIGVIDGLLRRVEETARKRRTS